MSNAGGDIFEKMFIAALSIMRLRMEIFNHETPSSNPNTSRKMEIV
jgi:hypothetical protein